MVSDANVNGFLKLQAEELGTQAEIAIVGRSNCGKSSLINALLNEKVAITSKTPGKTQQLIMHTLNLALPFRLSIVDAPGYGYANAPIEEMNKWRKFTSRYFQYSEKLFNTILLIDSRRGILESDKILIEMLEENKRTCTVVLTKADCLNVGELKNILIKTGHEINKKPRVFGTVFATSARLSYGIKELQAYMVYDLLNRTKQN